METIAINQKITFNPDSNSFSVKEKILDNRVTFERLTELQSNDSVSNLRAVINFDRSFDEETGMFINSQDNTISYESVDMSTFIRNEKRPAKK